MSQDFLFQVLIMNHLPPSQCAPPVSTTPVVQYDLQINLQIFEKMQNDTSIN
jgi:hypothetical protein